MFRRLLAVLLVAGPLSAHALFAPPSLERVRPIVWAGERYMALAELAPLYGFSLSIPPGRAIYLRSKYSSVALEADSRGARINGVQVWLHAPVMKLRGRWALTETDVRKVLDPLMKPSRHLTTAGYRVVVLDPGHGGLDRGANGHLGLEEKRAVLDIAKRVRLILGAEGLKVFLTRENDHFVELPDRSVLAARWGAHAFVSIHLNSAPSRSSSGLETYLLAAPGYPSTSAKYCARSERAAFAGNRQDAANTILGYYLHKNLLTKAVGEDRGLRRAHFVVLKNAPCPAALLECGFVSHNADEGRLLRESYRQTVAQGIAKGILDYFNAVKKAHVQDTP